jgi:hypothetical protein
MRDLEKGLTPPSGMFYRLESLAILHLASGKRVVCLYSRAQEGSKEVRKEGRKEGSSVCNIVSCRQDNNC